MNKKISDFIVRNFWRMVKIEFTTGWNQLWPVRKGKWLFQVENKFAWKGCNYCIYLRCEADNNWEAWLISDSEPGRDIYFYGKWEPMEIPPLKSWKILSLKPITIIQAKKLILKEWLKYTWVSIPTW